MKGSPEFPQCGFSRATISILQSYKYLFKFKNKNF